VRLVLGPGDVPEAVGAEEYRADCMRQEPASQRELLRVRGSVLRGRNMRGVELGFSAAGRRRSSHVQGSRRPVLLLLAEELRRVRHSEAKGL
jgi:hypothetical protein